MSRIVLAALGGLLLVAEARATLQRRLSAEGIELTCRFGGARLESVVGERCVARLGEPQALFPPDSSAAAVEWIVCLVALPELEGQPRLQWEMRKPRQWVPAVLATVQAAWDGRDTTTALALSPSVRLRPLGLWRGIPLALLELNPWEYDPERKQLRLWTELSVHIRYAEPVTTPVSHAWAPLEEPIARMLLNAAHALAFRHRASVSSVVGEPFLLERPAVRLGTQRDGIAMLPLSDVLALMPEWQGAPAERLQLLWFGRPVPLFLLDRDGRLDATDTLFFFGRRPAADTTWLDAYSREEALFLVLRDSGAAPRFAPLDESDGSEPSEAEILPTVLHWEEDRVYVPGVNEGFLRYRTETAPGEGWYWALVGARRPVWRDSLLLPALDAVRIRLRGYALNKLSACVPEHRWQIVLNGDTLGGVSRAGWGPLEWDTVLEQPGWSAGWNRFELRSVPADTLEGCAVAEQGIDFLEFLVKPQPVAVQGRWQGLVAAHNGRSRLLVHGLRFPDIVALDTLRGRIVRARGVPEGVLRVAARSGHRPQLEVRLGDSLLVRRTQTGILLLWWQPPRFELQQAWLRGTSPELSTVLRNIAPEALLLWVSLEEPSAEVLTLLRSWGLQWGEEAARGWAWIWALRRSDSAEKFEQVAPPGAWANALIYTSVLGSSYRLALAFAEADTAHLWVEDREQWQRPSLQRVEPVGLTQPEPQADVIVIAHPRLWSAAEQWAAYRRQSRGIRVRLVSIDEIATAFGYGRLSPHALKAFLRYAYRRWQPPAPQAVLLFGSANWDARGLLGYPKPNLIPSYGVPPSDYWYGLLEGDDWIAELFLGRIPAADSAEAVAVVEKIRAWEATPLTELWRKQVLLIFGYGFLNTSDAYYSWLTSVLGMQPRVFVKEIPEPSSSRYGPLIRQALEEGAGVTIYFGHGAEANMEVQGWEPERLTNTERQGILMTLSCSMGNFAVPYTRSFNEQYVVARRRGMVAALGMSGVGIDILERTVQHYFFEALATRGMRLLGPLYVVARMPLAPFAERDEYRATVLQHTLLGDPLLLFPVDTVPELFPAPPTPFVHRGDGVPAVEFAVGDSIRVRIAVGNAGVVPTSSWRMRLSYDGAGGRDTLWITGTAVRMVALWDTLLPPTWCQAGFHRLRLQLNPDSAFPESVWSNNGVNLSYFVRPRGLVPLEPLPFWHVQPGTARFRMLNPLGPAQAFQYEAELWQVARQIAVAVPAEWHCVDEVVEWQPSAVELQSGQRYRLRVRARGLGDTMWTQWLEVPFWVDTAPVHRWVRWQQQDSTELAANSLYDVEVVSSGDGGALVRLRQWRRSVELESDPVRLRAAIRIDGRAVLELEQEAGVGAVILPPGDSVPRAFFYRTGRTGQTEDAAYFLRLIRDSVRVGEYLLWTLSGDGLWRFTAEQLDTLRIVLRQLYGGRWVDSLTRSGIAFVFIGRRGGEAGSTIEAFRRGDSVGIRTQLLGSVSSGRLVTPWIGPARRFSTLELRLGQQQFWELIVYGRRDAQETERDIVWDGLVRGDTAIELSEHRYAFLQLELRAQYTDGEEPELQRIVCTFEPQGELAIPSLLVPAVLSGEPLPLQLRLSNRSLRTVVDYVQLRVGTRSAAEEKERDRWILTALLPPEGDTVIERRLPTVGWQQHGLVWATLRAEGELYAFNNTAEVSYWLGLDTLRPTLQVWWHDGEHWVALEPGISIARQPELWLVLLDNNVTAPVTRVQALRLWVEGQPMDSTTAAAYRFYPSSELDSLPAALRAPGVRAAVYCRPLRLPLGKLILWAIGEDAAGLRDTLELAVVVTDRFALRLLGQYPQPTVGPMCVRLVYEGYTAYEPVQMEIFSLLGQRLYAEEFSARVGEQMWCWSGRTSDGVPVGPGTYLWRLWFPRLGPAVGGVTGVVTVVP